MLVRKALLHDASNVYDLVNSLSGRLVQQNRVRSSPSRTYTGLFLIDFENTSRFNYR